MNFSQIIFFRLIRYEFEKRLFNVLNKDIFNTQFDPNKNVFDANGNFISNLEKNNMKNQKSKRKSQNNLSRLLKNNSFIYSNSSLNNSSLNINNNKRKFKSENNISDYKKNTSNQYISKIKASSYNNISSNNNTLYSMAKMFFYMLI